MLHLVSEPTLTNTNKEKKRIIYWKVVIALPQINPLEFKVSTLSEFALLTGINYITLRRIVYDKKYNSKKYDTLFKHVSITPVYV